MEETRHSSHCSEEDTRGGLSLSFRVEGAPPGQLWAALGKGQESRQGSAPAHGGLPGGPLLQKRLGDGSCGVTVAKVPASALPYHHQCPSLRKAPTNFSTRFA